jgi:hypothetical protein
MKLTNKRSWKFEKMMLFCGFMLIFGIDKISVFPFSSSTLRIVILWF